MRERRDPSAPTQEYDYQCTNNPLFHTLWHDLHSPSIYAGWKHCENVLEFFDYCVPREPRRDQIVRRLRYPLSCSAIVQQIETLLGEVGRRYCQPDVFRSADV